MPQGDSGQPEHLREAGETIHERIVQAIMSRVGRPKFVLFVVAIIVLWVVLNLVLRPYHLAFDTDTFAILNTISRIGGGEAHELHEPTDLRQAAQVLRKAEEEAGKDTEEKLSEPHE